MIEVRLFATFREGRGKVLELEPQKYPTALSIIEGLGIPLDDVAILLINGRHKKPGDKISDGDVLALFPPVGGG